MSGIQSDQRGVLLLAHGSRKPQWRRPFISMLASMRELAPDVAAELAYLSGSDPDFAMAFDDLVRSGVKTVTVVPMFLAAGGHVTTDLPLLVEAAMKRHPAVTVAVTAAIGELASVQSAMVAAVIEQSQR